MSGRYRDLLDLAQSSHARAQEQHQAGDHPAAANSFMSASRFFAAALREIDPDVPELPDTN